MEQKRKQTPKPYTPGFREGAVRLVAAHAMIAGKLGCSPDSLRDWVRQARCDGGDLRRSGLAQTFVIIRYPGA
jgi:transposase-like protein